MISVPFPPPHFKIEKRGDKPYVFDAIRNSWLLLTEEEWVRQNFVAYLTQTLLYPKNLIALEKALVLNGRKKRFDILVYQPNWKPWMMIECKAPTVPLTDTVLQQVLQYNISIPVPILVITNGQFTRAWAKREGQLEVIAALPTWSF